MKIKITKGLVCLENCHDLRRDSFIRFLCRSKRIFKYVKGEFSLDEYSSKTHAIYNSKVMTISSARLLVSAIKSSWLASDHFKETGYAISQLKLRGWTLAAIKKYLGEPDFEKKNPYYSSSANMKIFQLDRVLVAERSEQWLDWYAGSLDSRTKCSETRQKREAQKREELIKIVTAAEISFPKINKDKLFEKAIKHYNFLCEEREKSPIPDWEYPEKLFLHRITVNYLRHQYNDYDSRISSMTRGVNDRYAYILLKERILRAIGEKYPFLKNETTRQMDVINFEHSACAISPF